MSGNGFTIDRVSWHSRTPGNPESRDHIDSRFRSLFGFLRQHSLLQASAPVPTPEGQLPEDFELHSSHLTAEGLELMRAAYDRWLSALDQGTSPDKVSILENALAKARAYRA